MIGSWWTYLVVMVSCSLVSAGITRSAHSWKRIHTKPQTLSQPLSLNPRIVPSISILFSFLLAVPVCSLISPFVVGGKHLNIVLVVASSLLLIGIFHNLFSMLPTWHIGALISGGVIIWSIGDGIALQEQLPAAAALLFTILWFVILPMSFKQLDESERLTAGITILIGLGLFVLATMNLQPRLATCAIGLVGSNLGLLGQPRYSVRPHLGAGGALLDGFVIAYIALMLYPQQVSTSGSFFAVSALIPLILCLFPLINIAMTFLSTILRIFCNDNAPPSSIYSSLAVLIPREILSTVLIFLGVGLTSLVAIVLNRMDSATGLPIALLTVLSYITAASFLFRYSFQRKTAGQLQMRTDTS